MLYFSKATAIYLTVTLSFILIKESHIIHFLHFVVTVNLLKHSRNKLAPVTTYFIEAINCHSLIRISSFLSLEVN